MNNPTNIPNAEEPQDMVRPNINMPVDLSKALRKAAIDLDVSQSEVVVRALTEFLAKVA